jgi:PASTA domain
MSAFNAIAALAILNNPSLKNVSPDQRTLGVGTAAVIKGVLGILPSLLIAQQAQQATAAGTGGGFSPDVTPQDVEVPDVTSKHPPMAEAILAVQSSQLVAVQDAPAFSTEFAQGLVVGQDPSAGEFVTLGSNVRIRASAGPPPPVPDPDKDLDTDLTNKISEAKTELEGKISDAKTGLEGKIDKNAEALQRIEAHLTGPGSGSASRSRPQDK